MTADYRKIVKRMEADLRSQASQLISPAFDGHGREGRQRRAAELAGQAAALRSLLAQVDAQREPTHQPCEKCGTRSPVHAPDCDAAQREPYLDERELCDGCAELHAHCKCDAVQPQVVRYSASGWPRENK